MRSKTLLEFLESTHEGEIEGHYDMGSISREEYETLNHRSWIVILNGGCYKISAFKKDQHSDLIDERSKKSWSGHKRLKFPVVWNRESYNKIEPEIRTAGSKRRIGLKWLLANLTEGKDEYWTYEDRIINAAQLDMLLLFGFIR